MFLAAVVLPDTVFQVLAGGAVGSAFIPVFTAHWSRGDKTGAWQLTSSLANLAVLAMGTVAAALALAAPIVAGVLVPGWDPAERERTANLARIMLASPVLFALGTLATSALNGLNRFALAAAAPVVYNLSLGAGAVFLRALDVEGLALAAVAGALLHLAVQVPGLLRVGMRYSFTLGLRLAGTREVARLTVPRVLGLGVSQLSQVVTVALASLLVAGSIAYLSYAWLILMVPLGVAAMAISTAMFPTMAQEMALQHREEAQRTFLLGLRLILSVSLPSAAALIVLGNPLVALLLERGAFAPEAGSATAFALAWYAVGLPGHATTEIVSRAFYANRDTATPVRVLVGAVGLNILLSLLLMRTGLTFGGLALANAIAALAEATILTALLQRRLGWFRGTDLSFVARLVIATALFAAAAAFAGALLTPWVDARHWAGQLVVLAIAGGTGSVAYLTALWALGAGHLRGALPLLFQRGR
jgi:putative peptidoglycan lipid II flippase